MKLNDYVIVRHHEHGELVGKIVKDFKVEPFRYKIQTRKGEYVFAVDKYSVAREREEMKDFVICAVRDIENSTPEQEKDLQRQIDCIETILE